MKPVWAAEFQVLVSRLAVMEVILCFWLVEEACSVPH